MNKKRLIKIASVLALWGIILVVGFYFDILISSIVGNLRIGIITEILLGFTFVSSDIVILFFFTSLFLWKEHKRRWIFPFWMTLFSSIILGIILKIGFGRLRPYQLGISSAIPILEKASHFTWNSSFPSIHAMIVFCALPVLSKEFPRLKNYWIGFAIIVAFSRIYFGLHFLSDVLVGALLGFYIGLLWVKIEEKSQFGQRIYRMIFKK